MKKIALTAFLLLVSFMSWGEQQPNKNEIRTSSPSLTTYTEAEVREALKTAWDKGYKEAALELAPELAKVKKENEDQKGEIFLLRFGGAFVITGAFGLGCLLTWAVLK